MFDVVILGGTVVDGTGAPGYRADVGITGDSIGAIGDLSHSEARRVIDATGLTVAPGFIDTDMIGGLNEEQRENLKKEVVLGRLGEPNEIANVIRFIVTEGTYMTGSVFNVNGGMYM